MVASPPRDLPRVVRADDVAVLAWVSCWLGRLRRDGARREDAGNVVTRIVPSSRAKLVSAVSKANYVHIIEAHGQLVAQPGRRSGAAATTYLRPDA